MEKNVFSFNPRTWFNGAGTYLVGAGFILKGLGEIAMMEVVSIPEIFTSPEAESILIGLGIMTGRRALKKLEM